MSQSGDKYKIQIVRTGIGDPFLVLKYQFAEDGLNPVEYPINQMEFHFLVGNTPPSSSNGELAKVLTFKTSALGPYRIGVPFDEPEGFDPSSTAFARVYVFVNGSHDNVEFVNPNDDPGLSITGNDVTITLDPQMGRMQEFFDNVYYTWNSSIQE